MTSNNVAKGERVFLTNDIFRCRRRENKHWKPMLEKSYLYLTMCDLYVTVTLYAGYLKRKKNWCVTSNPSTNTNVDSKFKIIVFIVTIIIIIMSAVVVIAVMSALVFPATRGCDWEVVQCQRQHLSSTLYCNFIVDCRDYIHWLTALCIYDIPVLEDDKWWWFNDQVCS